MLRIAINWLCNDGDDDDDDDGGGDDDDDDDDVVLHICLTDLSYLEAKSRSAGTKVLFSVDVVDVVDDADLVVKKCQRMSRMSKDVKVCQGCQRADDDDPPNIQSWSDSRCCPW